MDFRRNQRSRITVIACALGATALASLASWACTSPGEDLTQGASLTSPLTKLSSTSLWTPSSGPIPIDVCIETAVPSTSCTLQQSAGSYVLQPSDIAQYVRAIENSWPKASRFDVRFKGKCDRVNDSSQKIVIWLLTRGFGVGTDGSTHGAGTAALRTVNAVACPENASTSIYYDGYVEALQSVGVHEFGHVLGWEHEQDQDGGYADPNANPGTPNGGCYPVSDLNDAGVLIPRSGGWPDQLLTPYDPDSIMNYCRQGRQTDGRLSDLDIQGLQGVYGATGRADSDGDGVLDYADNCRYVVNGSQADSNFDAELQVQQNAGYTGSTEGHVPTSGDLQSYVDRWRLVYPGDACDPVSTTRGASVFLSTPSGIRSSSCWDVTVINSSSTKTLNASASCPIRYNSQIDWDLHSGGPAGLAGSKIPGNPDPGSWMGASAPSFCKCANASSSNAALGRFARALRPSASTATIRNSPPSTVHCRRARTWRFITRVARAKSTLTDSLKRR